MLAITIRRLLGTHKLLSRRAKTLALNFALAAGDSIWNRRDLMYLISRLTARRDAIPLDFLFPVVEPFF